MVAVAKPDVVVARVEVASARVSAAPCSAPSVGLSVAAALKRAMVETLAAVSLGATVVTCAVAVGVSAMAVS